MCETTNENIALKSWFFLGVEILLYLSNYLLDEKGHGANSYEKTFGFERRLLGKRWHKLEYIVWDILYI